MFFSFKFSSKTNELILNMGSAFIGFAVSAAISFFIVPIARERVGEGAYGFLSLANNFVQYANILTIALNSMASRFITIKVCTGDYKRANEYYNSVIIANIFIAVCLLIPSIYIACSVDKLFNVSAELVSDVRLLFGFIFGNFILTIITSVFSCATYIRNKLCLSSLVTIVTTLLRGVLIFTVYSFLPAHIFYMGIIPLIMTVISAAANFRFTRQLVPELEISRKYFDIGAVKELVSSGIWNSILKMGQVLLDGLDVLIANLFIGAAAMDTLSFAETIPGMISSAMSTLSGVFAPSFNISYAKGQFDVLLKDIRQSIKIMSMIMNIPIAALTVFGYYFFKLWLPSEDPMVLQIISVLVVVKFVISGGVNCLSNVLTVTNKVKANAIAVLVSGALSICFTFVMLKITDAGIYVIAAGSTIFSIVRNLFFLMPYSAKCLNLKWNVFYFDVGKAVLSYAVMVIVGAIIVPHLMLDSWLKLGFWAVLYCIVCLIIGWFVILNKDDKNLILQQIRRKR